MTRLLDEIYLEFPFYGVRKMREELIRRGEQVERIAYDGCSESLAWSRLG